VHHGFMVAADPELLGTVQPACHAPAARNADRNGARIRMLRREA
jgi:hypothetical protein